MEPYATQDVNGTRYGSIKHQQSETFWIPVNSAVTQMICWLH